MEPGHRSVAVPRGSRGGSPSGSIPVADLDNDTLILRLHFTVNHLSRWLSPIHDQSRLDRSPQREEASVKELMIRLRDEERKFFQRMHVIATSTEPDLDLLPPRLASEEELRQDGAATVIEIMADFRRLRQSTCSLLRSLPDAAWQRRGISRREHDWTLRALGEHLVAHDRLTLSAMDRALARSGARTGIATVSTGPVDELLSLVPTRTR